MTNPSSGPAGRSKVSSRKSLQVFAAYAATYNLTPGRASLIRSRLLALKASVPSDAATNRAREAKLNCLP